MGLSKVAPAIVKLFLLDQYLEDGDDPGACWDRLRVYRAMDEGALRPAAAATGADGGIREHGLAAKAFGLFNSDVEISFKEPPTGLLRFRNVNFSNIGTASRERLTQLAVLGRLEIGSGCIKYRFPVAAAGFAKHFLLDRPLEPSQKVAPPGR